MKITAFSYGDQWQASFVKPVPRQTLVSGYTSSGRYTQYYEPTDGFIVGGDPIATYFTNTYAVSGEVVIGDEDLSFYAPLYGGNANWPVTTTQTSQSNGSSWDLYSTTISQTSSTGTTSLSTTSAISGIYSTKDVSVVAYNLTSFFGISLEPDQTKGSDVVYYGTFTSAPAGYIGPVSNLTNTISAIVQGSYIQEVEEKTSLTWGQYISTSSASYSDTNDWGWAWQTYETKQLVLADPIYYSITHVGTQPLLALKGGAIPLAFLGTTYGDSAGEAFMAATQTGSSVFPDWPLTASEHPAIRNIISYPDYTTIADGYYQYSVTSNSVFYKTTLMSAGNVVEVEQSTLLSAVGFAETSQTTKLGAGWYFGVFPGSPLYGDVIEDYRPQGVILPGGQTWSAQLETNYSGYTPITRGDSAVYNIYINGSTSSSSQQITIGTDFSSVFESPAGGNIYIEPVECVTPPITYGSSSIYEGQNGQLTTNSSGYVSWSYVL